MLRGENECRQENYDDEQAAEKVRQHRSRIVQTLNVPQECPSGLHSLRPCWTAFLSSLRDRTHVALAVRSFVCVRANIVFPQTASARIGYRSGQY